MDHTKRDWLLLIKQLRSDHGIGILEAERLALEQPTWRRWVERQINSDPQCRKMARYHLRANGSSALLEVDGERLKVR